MIELGIQLLLAYGLGCCLGSQLLRAALGGSDVRGSGSGGAGATNALRARGPLFALAVLGVDIGKGVLAVAVIPLIDIPGVGAAALSKGAVGLCCGAAAVIGHIWPAPFGFRGGKGAATLVGVYAWIVPFGVLWAMAVFTLVILVTGYVGVATVSAAGIVVVYVGLASQQGIVSALGLFAALMWLLLAWSHRENLQRLLDGEENQFGRARLIGNRLPQRRPRHKS